MCEETEESNGNLEDRNVENQISKDIDVDENEPEDTLMDEDLFAGMPSSPLFPR